MQNRVRVFCLAIVSVLSVGVVGAALAWACTPPGFGTPASPTAAPNAAPTPNAPAPTPTPTPPAAADPAPTAAAPAAAPAPAVVQSSAPVSATTSGATARSSRREASSPKTSPAAPATSPARSAKPRVPVAPTRVAPVVARQNGATAGVQRQGAQSVFSSSAAPARARVTKKAEPKTGRANATPAPRATPPAGSSTSDLWSGVAAPAKSPLAAAEATSGGKAGGLPGSVVAGLLVLALGMAGLTGAFVVTTGRRRASSKRNTR